MAGRECHHCKQWIEQGEAHDCWTTTEAALTRDLTEDLREAWERLRETAAGFGQQRIYASGHAIMFARKTCYFFVRPKKMFLEVCVFLGRTIKASQVRRVDRVSKSKLVHIIRITHRDEVEAPVTDWLREAYEVSDALSKGDAALKTNTNSDKNAATRGQPKIVRWLKSALSALKGLLLKGTMARNSSGSALSAARFPAQSKRFLTASPHSSRRSGSSPCLLITTTATATSRFGSLPLPACKPL